MKKKVILINLPPTSRYDYSAAGTLYPATGLLAVGTILKGLDIDVRLVDGAIRSDYAEEALGLIGDDVLMVGFSVMTSQVPMALYMSRLIKEKRPVVPIVWGGIHPILFPEQTVKSDYVDIVVTGEGHRATMELVDHLLGRMDIDRIKGIGFKDVSGEAVLTGQGESDDINALPHFDYSILGDSEIYLGSRSVYSREIAVDNGEKVRIMPVLTGLGCCYKCQFCINVFLKRKYRFRPASSIIGEIKKLQRRYRANAFIFYDEDFLISKQRLLEFLDLIEKEGLKFYWRIWARVNYFRENYLTKDLILRMEKTGLRSIVMGAESGSQKVLDLIEKGIKVDSIPYSARLLNGTKITPRYSFIVGINGENKDDTLKTYKLCGDIMDINRRVDIAGPFIFRYYPGSPIFDKIVESYNIEIPRRLEDWRGALSNEGFLRMDKMPWLWPGFTGTVVFLNDELQLLSRFQGVGGIFGGLVKRYLRWRIKSSCQIFPVEIYVFNFMRAVYHKYSNFKARQRGGPAREGVV